MCARRVKILQFQRDAQKSLQDEFTLAYVSSLYMQYIDIQSGTVTRYGCFSASMVVIRCAQNTCWRDINWQRPELRILWSRIYQTADIVAGRGIRIVIESQNVARLAGN